MGMPDLAAIWAVVPGGDDWIIVSNRAYEEACSDSQPPHIGRLASDVWGSTDAWTWFFATAKEIQQEGKSFTQTDELFFVKGQETYWIWRWTPILGEDGRPLGILLTAFESTARVISEVGLLIHAHPLEFVA